MRVLVTRPEPDAQALAKAVAALGHEPLVAPLMTVELLNDPLPDDLGGAALLFTSANGVRAAKGRGLLSPDVYAIGAATAAAAREAGYTVAGTAAGDVNALAELVAAQAPKSLKLVHVSGADAAGDLAGKLAQRGFAVRRLVAYRARAAESLPEIAASFLAGSAGAALFLSPRTAGLFTTLTVRAGLARDAAKHQALALSEAVAANARALPWRSMKIAVTPEVAALLALL